MKNDIQFHFANPILPVKNTRETARYYQENLGFSIDVLWQNPNYACVSRGGITLEFGEGRPDHVGCGVCVIGVSNVDRLYNELKEKGVQLVGDFAERDYGSKDFRVKDNNGNLLIFGEALPNKDGQIKNGNIAP